MRRHSDGYCSLVWSLLFLTSIVLSGIALSRHVFPTPENLIDHYRAEDENTGKLIDLPHPVRISQANLIRIIIARSTAFDCGMLAVGRSSSDRSSSGR